MDQYVCVRIVQMDRVDIGLFDYDRYNTLYFFVLNADEEIYLRYGGRDAQAPDSYLNLDSLELALKHGIELHRRKQEGKWTAPPRPEPLYPQQIQALYERTTGRGSCVECHLIGDLQNVQRERDGVLDKLKHMYRSPDIKTIGIHLDVPKGLLVKEVDGAVKAAGMLAGDTITAIEGKDVYTFGDLQDRYDKVDRMATKISLKVDRGGEPVELSVALPSLWWETNLAYRQLSVDPRVFFRSRPLTAAEKKERDLPADGFASEIEFVDRAADLLGNHKLQLGDVVYGVDGVQTDEIANRAELYIKLRKSAGSTMRLDVIRGGERMQTPLRTDKVSFRK